MADSDEVDYRSPSSDSEFTPVIQPNHFLNHHILTFTATPIMPRIGTGMLVPNPTVKLLKDASEEEVYDFPDEDDVIFCEFADKIIAMAQDLARQNSKYSTNEIPERSLNITIAAAKRLRFNKLSGWQVAMREEKELVATDLRQPVSGKGYKGRKGFDGRYSQHVAEVYQDPEKREFYMKRAEEINEEGRVGLLTSLKSTQKKSLNRLTKFLHELAGNEVHLIVMAVPSKAKPILFTSAGFGGAYYKLIVQSSRGQDEFITTCEGGALLQEAAKATTSTYNGTSGRNLMRSEIVQMLKELISKNIYFLLNGNADESSNQYTTVVLGIDRYLRSISNAQNFVTTFTTISITANIRQYCSVSIFITNIGHQYWIVLLSTNLNIKILILKLEIDGYPQYKISKYLLVSNFTTTTTPSNITNALQRLFGSPAATMSYVSRTGRKAKSTIVETAAFGGIGGRKRATMNARQADNLLKRRAPDIRPKPHWLRSVPVINHNRGDGNLQLRKFSIKIQIIFPKHLWLTSCSRRNGSVLIEFKYNYFLHNVGQRSTLTIVTALRRPVLCVRGSISKSAWADGLLAVYESDHKTSLPNFARSVLAQLRDCYHHWVAVQYAISTAVYRNIDLFQGEGEKSWQLERLANLCPACFDMESGEDHTAFITLDGNMQHTRFKDRSSFEFEVFSPKLFVDYGRRQFDLAANQGRPYESCLPDTACTH
ncbi:hypothetical protein BDD12DRAFT_802556 [Trichophaea hybrida]|nr:hypothetical protein BDD12DRAFT_802556 [Trichophaea hybrida]